MDDWDDNVREAYLRALNVIRAGRNMRADAEYALVVTGKRTAKESYLAVQEDADPSAGAVELRQRLKIWHDEMGDRV
jgi:hypothetical protein